MAFVRAHGCAITSGGGMGGKSTMQCSHFGILFSSAAF
jgi:hypothetical protein